MAETVTDKHWWDFFWPAGGTLLGLVVMPVAIGQYPSFFNENKWVLPVSVAAVLICWLVPLLLHDRTRKWFKRLTSIPHYGWPLFIAISVVAVVMAALGTRILFRFHENHLRTALAAAPLLKPNMVNPALPPPSTPSKPAGTPKKRLIQPTIPRPNPGSSDDPEIAVLKDAIKSSADCRDFMSSDIERMHGPDGPFAKIANRQKEAGHKPAQDQDFAHWAAEVFQQEEMNRYAAYKEELKRSYDQLVRALPETNTTLYDPSQVVNVSYITGVCYTLRELTQEYQSKLINEGKIPKPQR